MDYLTNYLQTLEEALRGRHRLSNHPLYQTWKTIRNRIRPDGNPDSKVYSHYSKRGIKGNRAWINDPDKFIKDIERNIGKRPSPKHSLDRIDNNKGYYIDNLQWADYTGQNRNRSNVVLSKDKADDIRKEFKKGDATRQELADKYGVSLATVKRLLVNSKERKTWQ